MLKQHKLAVLGILFLIVIAAAGIGSYAMAQSDGEEQAPAINDAAGHVDYDVSLQVTGDLAAVDPRLAGVLPLNLTAKGSADIKKSENGIEAKGDVALGGLETLAQMAAAASGDARNAQSAGALVSGALSDVQFVAVDKNLYVNLLGSWYDTGSLAAGHQNRGDDEKPDDVKKDEARAACPEGTARPDLKSFLKDQKQVGTESIDGVSTTHFSASIDVDKALTDAAAMARACGKPDEAAQLDAARAQILGAAKALNVEWWIDADGQVHQVKADIQLAPSALAPLVSGMAGASDPAQAAKVTAALSGVQSVSLQATVKLSHIGEDFQVAKPDGIIKPLEDLTRMMGAFGGGTDGTQSGGDE